MDLLSAGRAIALERELERIKARFLARLRDYNPRTITQHVKDAELRAGEQYRAWLERHETERRER